MRVIERLFLFSDNFLSKKFPSNIQIHLHLSNSNLFFLIFSFPLNNKRLVAKTGIDRLLDGLNLF